MGDMEAGVGYLRGVALGENERDKQGTTRGGMTMARKMAWAGAFLILVALLAWWWKPGMRPAKDLPEVGREALALREGRLYLTNSTTPFEGVVVERYPDGVVRSRSDVRAGRLHGESRGWYPGGQIQVLEHFEDGVSHGVRTKWHENGERQSEAQIVRGVIEGVFRRWHPEGGLAEEIPMKAGQPDGLAKSFEVDGSLKAEAVMKGGQVVTQKFFKVAKPAEPLTTGPGGGAMPRKGP